MASRALRSSRQSDATSQEVTQQPAKKRRLNPKNNTPLQPTRGQPANAQWVTYRVSRIPDTYDRASFDDAFSASLQLTSQSVKSTIHSFASDVPKERTATVTFTTTPSALDAAGAHNTQEWDIYLVHPILGQTDRVSIDTHFKGFTPVSPLGEDTEHVIDCIAIHGWGSHPLGGFKAHNDTYVWLRDKLAIRIPRLRVFIYGYKCDLTTDDSISGVDEWADTLRRLLRQIRGQDNTGPPVPLVFFAHSLGGIVLKQALIRMKESSDVNDDRNLHSVYGALFFGVPSQGMDIEALAAMVGDNPQRYTLSLLDQQVGQLLRNRQHEDFCRALDFEDSKIIQFFETRKTSTVIEDQATKKWTRTGPKKLLVNPVSATLGRAWETSNDYKVNIDADHSNIVKFSRSDRDGSVKVYDELQKFADEAVKVIEQRFQRRTRELSLRDHAQKHGYVPNRSMESEDLTCLRSLAFPEMDYRRQDAETAYPKTCEWITRHQSYTSWLEDGSGILWIKGTPGSGKSTLMKFLLRDLKQKDLYQKSVRLSFFFHGRGALLQKSRLGMYRSLLHQLLRKAPSAQAEFRRAFQEKLDTEGDPGKDWNWHVNKLRAFFVNAVEHIAETQLVTIFVDALDEASDGTEDHNLGNQIVEDFYELNDLLCDKKLRSMICFSSRHHFVISDNRGQNICVENENKGDISAYVCGKLEKKFLESKSEQQDWAKLRDTIIHGARGIFQWVVIVVRLAIIHYDKGFLLEEVSKKLAEVPEELGQAYTHILTEVIDKEDYPNTLRLMRWVCLAEWPLTITKIRFAMDLQDTEIPGLDSVAQLDLRPHDMMVKRIVSLSGGLVETTKQNEKDQIVQVIHQSVNDFLLRDGLQFFDKTSRNPIGQGHHQLSLICANYMRTTEICSANTPDAESVKTALPFMDYVVRSWFLHAEKAETRGIPQDYLLRYIQYYPTMLENWIKFYRLLDPYDQSERRPEESSTMLHIASGAGLLSVVEGLLLTPQDLEQIDNVGNRAIHYACRWGHLRIVKALLDAGAFFEIDNNNRSTPLERAAANGHEEIVELLLTKGADVNKQTGQTGNPLYGASLKGRRAVVQLLLDKQANVNAKGGKYGNALQAAAWRGRQAVVQLLLDKQANVNAEGGHYGNALQAAAFGGNQAVVQLLFDKQANVNAEGGKYGNALQAALYAGHQLIVHLLYKNSASSMDKDSQGRYPLHLAIRGGHYQTINLVLSKIGTPDWKYQDMQGCSALHFAASGGSDKTLQAILDSNNVDINLVDTYGWTALHWACRNGSHKIVRMLREYGADSNQKDSNGWTPLDVAIFCRNESLASLFQDDKSQIKSEQPRTKPGNYYRRECSSCYHGIYSKRYRCKDCGFYNLCFRCIKDAVQVHQHDHKFEVRET